MNSILQIADQTILPASSNHKLLNDNGDTKDIVRGILKADKISGKYTKGFAGYLKSEDRIHTAKNVFDFILNNIKYQVDPLGIQWIKSPSQSWKDRYADCKSMSIFSGSIFKNLGIPYAYRFVSYSDEPIWTHVYIIIYDENGKEIIVDPVYKKFNKQKSFQFKKDYKMSRIEYISGIGASNSFKLGKNLDEMSEAELDLKIAKDLLQTHKNIADRLRGIGSLKSEQYQDAIDFIGDLEDEVNSKKSIEAKINGINAIEEDASYGDYSLANKISGIGDIGKRASVRKAKRVERKAIRKSPAAKAAKKQARSQRKKKSSSKRKAFVKKLGAGLKKGLKAVSKVYTAPLRLAAKGILEVALPQAAPFFLYLFLPPSALAKVPSKVKTKYDKAKKIKDFIVNGIGMKESHFLGIVRNGITKKYGRSPEAVLTQYTKGIAGIGLLPAPVIGVLIKIIQKISSLIKKKSEKVSTSDAPDPSDFSQATVVEKAAIKEDLKDSNPSPTVIDEQEGNAKSQSSSNDNTSSSDGGEDGSTFMSSGKGSSSMRKSSSSNKEEGGSDSEEEPMTLQEKAIINNMENKGGSRNVGWC